MARFATQSKVFLILALAHSCRASAQSCHAEEGCEVSSEDETAAPRSVRALIQAKTNEHKMRSGELKAEDYRQITYDEKKQCADAGRISGKLGPDQCLDETGAAKQSCCLQACTDNPSCDGIWYRPAWTGSDDMAPYKYETCLLFSDCTKVVKTAGSSNGTGSIYVKKFINTNTIQSYTEIVANAKKVCGGENISGVPAPCLDYVGSAKRTCCAQACTDDQACGGIWWRPEQDGKPEDCALFKDCTPDLLGGTAGSGKGLATIYKKN